MFTSTHLAFIILSLFSTTRAQHSPVCADNRSACSPTNWGTNSTTTWQSGAIVALRDAIQLHIDDVGGEVNATETKYEANKKIACSINTSSQAICAFYEGDDYNNDYNIVDARNALSVLIESGCVVCGHTQLYGIQTSNGQLSTDYFEIKGGDCVGAAGATNTTITC